MTQHGKITELAQMTYEICPEIDEYFLHISLIAKGKILNLS